MELIADGLLFIATMVAALYCLVLSRRLRRLTNMDAGVGEAITAMSTRVDEMNNALTSSQKSTQKAVADLDTRLAAAKAVLTKLEAATSASGIRRGPLAVSFRRLAKRSRKRRRNPPWLLNPPLNPKPGLPSRISRKLLRSLRKSHALSSSPNGTPRSNRLQNLVRNRLRKPRRSPGRKRSNLRRKRQWRMQMI